MQIAIDGPAGAGKSTIAKELAKQLGFTYIDTGAMYRALTLKGLREGLEIRVDNPELIESVLSSRVDFKNNRIFLDDEDVTDLIRSEAVNKNVSIVSSIKEVREKLVELQRNLSRKYSVVMDGRDIGSVVLPQADLKIYLDASPRCRAVRRATEMEIYSPEEIAEIEMQIKRRDHIDSTREYSPLVKAEDAEYILTDNMTIPEVVEKVVSFVKVEEQS